MSNLKNLLANMSKKTLILTLALTLAVGGVASGTLAWLIDSTQTVTNTFTYGDINIELEETPTDDGDNDDATNSYKMMPGETITKDPTVTVKADSEDCWLFVQMVKANDFDSFMEYEMAEGWTELETGVYYRAVDAVTADTEFDVIKDDKVKVKGEVTKDMLEGLNGQFPTLTVKAYAVQRSATIEEIDTAAEAWALATAGSTNP